MRSLTLVFPSCPVSKDVTRQAYEDMLGQELTDDDYEDARSNLAGFFAVLMEIDRDLRLSQRAHEDL